MRRDRRPASNLRHALCHALQNSNGVRAAGLAEWRLRPLLPTRADPIAPPSITRRYPLEDSFYLATGRQLWDASFISVPTLVIASQRDFWSRPEDRDLLFARLVHARVKRLVVIPNATHFVHLDRGDRGRDRLLAEITHFCARSTPST
jgi:pimeloyl-ACP methyl ester carboxylesterase